MATPTHIPLANITLASTAASVTFSAISQSYKDLVLVMKSTTGSTNSQTWLRFNSDTTSTINGAWMLGNGTSAQSTFISNTYIAPPFYTSAAVSSININIFDYSATDKFKPISMRADGNGTSAVSGYWPSTAAVTQLVLTPSTGTFSIGSTFALYGIAA